MARKELEALIGKHCKSEEAKAADWLGYWPAIGQDGIIREILDGDNVPESAVMVNWSTDTTKGHPVKTDGEHGFEAVLYSSY